MNRADELRFVSALRTGDQSAFASVYDLFRARIFSFILRLVSRRAIAEELSQEVWLRLAARATSLREDTNLEAWLFTVAHNLCLSYWRTTSIDPTQWESGEVVDAVACGQPPPDEAAALRELQDRVERALGRTPPLYREALLLVGVQGMTPAAAAVVCSVSPEAMRKRLERARDMLAKQMAASPQRGLDTETGNARRVGWGFNPAVRSHKRMV